MEAGMEEEVVVAAMAKSKLGRALCVQAAVCVITVRRKRTVWN
jgi:hypothetical protein